MGHSLRRRRASTRRGRATLEFQHQMRQPDSQAGYTLIELLVVIAIIAKSADRRRLPYPVGREAVPDVYVQPPTAESGGGRHELRRCVGRASWLCEYRCLCEAPLGPVCTESGTIRRYKPDSWAVLLLPFMERTDLRVLWDNPERELVVSDNPLVFDPEMVQYLSFLVCPSSGKNENMARAANCMRPTTDSCHEIPTRLPTTRQPTARLPSVLPMAYSTTGLIMIQPPSRAVSRTDCQTP